MTRIAHKRELIKLKEKRKKEEKKQRNRKEDPTTKIGKCN